MNDNDPDGIYEPPEWVWDILAKHDLESDSLLGATMELLTMTAAGLEETSQITTRDAVMSVETKLEIEACKAMLADVEKLYQFCPTVPTPGVVTERDDGLLTWIPDPPSP